MIDTHDKFYLGRIFDPQTGQTGDQPLLYDSADLTTHAVVVGMTGSGKTGLCLDLMEEAALDNIPALMIDPKGDITNALLHFPQFRPSDFQPWVNADEARRAGKSVEQTAAETAELWRNGLARWDIFPDRVQALKDSVQFAIFTPGSDAGLTLSILASLAAPQIPWESNKELLREKISGTVTALLGLIGLRNIDPVRSREHILLANIFEHAWSQNHDLDLGELIMQTQSPPFDKLGVFDVNRFFPEKDRFDLAMLLNNILAAPAFQTWIEGHPLDIPRLLYDERGKARHTIFYLAHLPEAERMFFVTLLYSAIETWMRTQSGITSLRALVYFDEIFGYMPPVGNPPAKEPMLRMLKQARAFGVGMVLATQNPVDVDYKALSNAGTWFIGKLATEQDKARLLDGLSSAMPGGLDRREYDQLISAIGKRVFLLRNIHDKHPLLFQTRWAMNYLAGPVTRAQIPALNALAGIVGPQAGGAVASAPTPAYAPPAAAPGVPSPTPAPAPTPAGPELPGSRTRPAVPGRMAEYFLPNTLTLSQAAREYGRFLPPQLESLGILYQPVLLAQTQTRYLNRKYNLDQEVQHAALVIEPDSRGTIRWENFLVEPIDQRRLDRDALPEARFAALSGPLTDARLLKSLESDFVDWVYRTAELQIKANEKLGVYAGPETPDADFAAQCQKEAAAKVKAESAKIETQYARRIDSLKTRLAKEERTFADAESEYKRRKVQETATHAETLINLLSKRRRSVSSSMTKRGMTARARESMEKSQEQIARLRQELAAMEAEMREELANLQEQWREVAADVTTVPVSPFKKDIVVDLFGVGWVPYHMVSVDNRLVTLPGFQVQEL